MVFIHLRTITEVHKAFPVLKHQQHYYHSYRSQPLFHFIVFPALHIDCNRKSNFFVRRSPVASSHLPHSNHIWSLSCCSYRVYRDKTHSFKQSFITQNKQSPNIEWVQAFIKPWSSHQSPLNIRNLLVSRLTLPPEFQYQQDIFSAHQVVCF